jgi:hypothetical protein
MTTETIPNRNACVFATSFSQQPLVKIISTLPGRELWESSAIEKLTPWRECGG